MKKLFLQLQRQKFGFTSLLFSTNYFSFRKTYLRDMAVAPISDNFGVAKPKLLILILSIDENHDDVFSII